MGSLRRRICYRGCNSPSASMVFNASPATGRDGGRTKFPCVDAIEIEAVAANPVQASERGVEFFAQGLWLTGSIALDEPIAVSMPFAEDIDWVVELSGFDCRQESRLQHLVDKPSTGGRNDGLISLRQALGSTFRCQAAAFLGSVVFRQFHGSSSSSFWTGCSAMRASTSASQACGSTSLSLAV